MKYELITTLSLPDLKDLVRESVKEALEETQSLQSSCSKQEETQDQILTIQEAAEFLRLAVPTIYGLTSRKQITFFKRGKKLYFRKPDLLQWIENGKRSSKADIDRMADNYLNNNFKR